MEATIIAIAKVEALFAVQGLNSERHCLCYMMHFALK
jgi:hypothetical protein